MIRSSILDEAQNKNSENRMKSSSRSGISTPKAVITGDITQTTCPSGGRQAWLKALEVVGESMRIAFIKFDEARCPLRHNLVAANYQELMKDSE